MHRHIVFSMAAVAAIIATSACNPFHKTSNEINVQDIPVGERWNATLATPSGLAGAVQIHGTGYIARDPWHRSTIVLGIVAFMAAMWAVVLLWPGDAPLWMLAVLVVATGMGGPGSMIGFDVARTFAPASRLGSATGIVNIGGFSAGLLAVLAVGLVLDRLGSDPHGYKVAMSVQYVGWVVGGAQVWRYRRRARAHLALTQPEAYRAMTGEAS